MKKILTINCKESEINRILNIKKINVDNIISVCLIVKDNIDFSNQEVKIFYKNKENDAEIKNKN